MSSAAPGAAEARRLCPRGSAASRADSGLLASRYAWLPASQLPVLVMAAPGNKFTSLQAHPLTKTKPLQGRLKPKHQADRGASRTQWTISEWVQVARPRSEESQGNPWGPRASQMSTPQTEHTCSLWRTVCLGFTIEMMVHGKVPGGSGTQEDGQHPRCPLWGGLQAWRPGMEARESLGSWKGVSSETGPFFQGRWLYWVHSAGAHNAFSDPRKWF